jgi:flagellar protein FlgJ
MEISNLIAGQLDLAQQAVSQPLALDRTVAQASGRGKTQAELHKAGQEFESYFISYLIKNMRETIPKGLFDRKGEQVWYSFYDQEIARLATQAGGIGITAFVDAYTEKNR